MTCFSRAGQWSFSPILQCRNFQQDFFRKIHGVPESECVLQESVCKKYLIRMKIALKLSVYMESNIIMYNISYFYLSVQQVSVNGDSLCLMHKAMEQAISTQTFCIFLWSGLSQCLSNSQSLFILSFPQQHREIRVLLMNNQDKVNGKDNA